LGNHLLNLGFRFSWSQLFRFQEKALCLSLLVRGIQCSSGQSVCLPAFLVHLDQSGASPHGTSHVVARKLLQGLLQLVVVGLGLSIGLRVGLRVGSGS